MEKGYLRNFMFKDLDLDWIMCACRVNFDLSNVYILVVFVVSIIGLVNVFILSSMSIIIKDTFMLFFSFN